MKRTLLFFLLFVFLFGLWAQVPLPTDSDDLELPPAPRWARDLRRAEIIAFGAFPFMFFFANFGYDTYRFATHNWDRRYAPRPFNSAGSVEQSQSEKIMTIGIAAGSAIVFSLVDHVIMRAKRSRLERASRDIPVSDPNIIRRPLNEEQADMNTSELSGVGP